MCLYLIVYVCLLEIETESVYNCVFSGSTGALRCSLHTQWVNTKTLVTPRSQTIQNMHTAEQGENEERETDAH